MKPIAFIDIESTGTDLVKDKIITLAVLREAGYSVENPIYKFNPGIPIPPEATECHGITDDMVKDWPKFSMTIACCILHDIQGCDIGGFNHINFDVPMLWEEFNRVMVPWDLINVSLIDVGNIFKKKEDRTLSAAVKFYCQRNHETAHSADGDVIATKDVLGRQLFLYDDLRKMSREELATFCKFDDRIDLAGKILRDKDGDPCYAIGKAKGVKVEDDPGFGRWMLNQSFSDQTKMVVREILNSL